MKRLFFFVLTTLAITILYAEESSLYDVNYDPPKNTATYDETSQAFQNIYLQYELAVRNSELDIRSNEQNVRQNEILKERQKAQTELKVALKKQREEIYANEVELLRTHEREKLTLEINKKLSVELTEKFTKEYEDKKNVEVAALEKELRNTISLENENLKAQFKDEVRRELTSEYETKKNEEVAALEKELRNTISLENENLKAQFKDEVRNELQSEYELKKNTELKILAKQQRKKIFEETHTVTERFKILAVIIIVAIGVIVLFMLVKFIVKLKADKDEEQLREQNKKDLINYVSNTYLNELKRFDGKTAVLDAIKKIRSDIDNSTVGENEKSIRRRAIEIAEERYNQYKATCTIEEYKSLFNSLDAKKIFNNWNAFNDDSEMKRGLCNEFMTKINDYNKFATEAYNSNNEKDEIAKMFKIYVKPLENTANQVKVLSQAELQEDIKNYLIDISEKYMDLSKKFEKGEF
ncbi:MAG: hypothetical protein SO238_10095 [Treponema sp.]|nr:hypothetical protein [Treponema sp.]